MKSTEVSTVAVLVATAHRSELLESRALPSIKRQSRPPSRVIVVDNSGDDAAAERTEQAIRRWQPTDIVVDFLRNRRTKFGAQANWARVVLPH